MPQNKSDKIKIVVVDDHPMFRDGVVRLIEADPGMAVVATGSNALEAVQLAALHEPHIMLLDVNMVGGGVAAARTIRQSRPGIKILMLSMNEDQDVMMRSLRYGAVGYVLKGIGGAALLCALRLALSNAGSIDKTVARNLLATDQAAHGNRGRGRPNGCRQLTELETSWLSHAEGGMQPDAIAHQLGVDPEVAASVVSAILINQCAGQASLATPASVAPVPSRTTMTRH